MKDLANLMSDVTFNYELLEGLYWHARKENSSAYFYRFDYEGDWSLTHYYDKTKADYGGVAHLDDIRFFMP